MVDFVEFVIIMILFGCLSVVIFVILVNWVYFWEFMVVMKF